MKCRVCLGGGKMLNIFEEWNSYKISTKLMTLTNIKIALDDELPKTICKKCIKKLDQCIDFIELCNNSDEKLRTALNFIKTEKRTASTNYSADDLVNLGLDTIKNEVKSEFTEIEFTPTQDQILPEIINTLLEDKHANRKDQEVQNYVIVKNTDTKKIRTKNAQCFICGKILSCIYRLKSHIKNHSEERPFTCYHCDKSFKNRKTLSQHMDVHTDKRPYKCTECNATFRCGSTLKTHRRQHTGETPYHCKMCPRKFHSAAHYQYHIKKHTDEKNFECDLCGKAFIGRSHLTTHLLSHSGEQPHVCSICGARFSRKCNLKRHIKKQHSAFKPQENYESKMLVSGGKEIGRNIIKNSTNELKT